MIGTLIAGGLFAFFLVVGALTDIKPKRNDNKGDKQ